jgi:hypothetical protein
MRLAASLSALLLLLLLQVRLLSPLLLLLLLLAIPALLCMPSAAGRGDPVAEPVASNTPPCTQQLA